MPACVASGSTASGKESPSVIIRKSKMLPFLPDEKSNHAIFWSLTKNEGVFSLLKGESPFHSRPDFLSFTRRPTTSETGRRARSSSRNSGEKRMVIREDSADRAGIYGGRDRREDWAGLSRLSTGQIDTVAVIKLS